MAVTDKLASVTQIGRYVDCEMLGHGGMGAVYRARDPELDRPVAIKVMLEATEDFIARFRREAQSIAKLAHANIVQIYDFGVDDDNNPYFVMELIDGTPLDKIVRERGRLAPLEVIRLAKQAAEGLAAAHRSGIVHRDVKPSNLIVDGRGTVKLVDFGIARDSQAQSQLTGAMALMGTPSYMAPEQAAGKPVDHRADVYALGLTIYELLAGAPPFVAADPIALVVKQMQEALPDLRVHAPGVPDELAALVEMMARKDPEERLQSCDAAVAALGNIEKTLRESSGEGATNPVPPTRMGARAPQPAVPAASPLPSTISRKKTPLILVGALVAVAIPVLVIATRGPTPVEKPIEKPVEKPVVIQKVDPAAQKVDPTGPLKVAVLKFKNVSGEATLQPLEQGIGEAIMTHLSGKPGVKLFERYDLESDIAEIDRRNDEHFDVSTLPSFGKLSGVELAVQGAFQKFGKQIRVTARVVRVQTGEVAGAASVTRTVKESVFDVQDAVANEIEKKLLELVRK